MHLHRLEIKKIDSSFDIYIATAGKDLLNTAKDKLEKANDHFNKTGTLALAKTMKTGFISEFKTVSISGVICYRPTPMN